MKYISNKLTLLYSEIYYKEENYLKVRTAVFKYITLPYNKRLVLSRSRHEPEYNVLNEVVIEKATYA